MTFGEKIKQERIKRGITQAELCGGYITRNMLSAIESDKACPSIATARYLSERLSLPISYLLSDDDTPFYYLKRQNIDRIIELYHTGNYAECLSVIADLEGMDDELYFISAVCNYFIGLSSFNSGSFVTAADSFTLSKACAEKTVYDTRLYEINADMYLSVCSNTTSPLLEFDFEEYAATAREILDMDFYNYLTLEQNYTYTDKRYTAHLEAKMLIKERRYQDALKILLEIEESKSKYPRNAYLMFLVYTDIESCYKQLAEFEYAYRYSAKRISLLEGFSS